MTERRFQAKVEKAGSGARVTLPFDPNDAWGARQRHHVTGAVGGCAIRGELKRDGGWFVSIGPAWLRDNPVSPGTEVEVTLSPEGPLVGRMAEDVSSALAADTKAQAFFESLPTFYRNNFVRWIEQAKRPETRAKRIVETVRCMREGRRER